MNKHDNDCPSLFRLDTHPSARNRAVSIARLKAGTTIQSSTPLATVLIESEKGKRCDSCLFQHSELQRCTGCRLYWYCDRRCQLKAWKVNHKQLCPRIHRLIATLPPEDDLMIPHCLLLTNLLVEHGNALKSALKDLDSRQTDLPDQCLDPLLTLLTLLPGKTNSPSILEFLTPFCDQNLISYVSSRFAQNNFAIHSSRMNVVGHGVFPLASRAFNHSCFPNAIPIYHFSKFSGIRMDIRLLRAVEAGEEITIPYIDPAFSFSLRQMKLKDIYGFVCNCVLCLPPLNESNGTTQIFDSMAFEDFLKAKVLPLVYGKDNNREKTLMSIRHDWLRSIPSTYLPALSEEFSHTSHVGPYSVAAEKGRLLLALYSVVYPTNFPLIALQALELAKTCWNSFAVNPVFPLVLDDMQGSLKMAQDIFEILYDVKLGSTKNYPQEQIFEELSTLKEMLASDPDIRLASQSR